MSFYVGPIFTWVHPMVPSITADSIILIIGPFLTVRLPSFSMIVHSSTMAVGLELFTKIGVKVSFSVHCFPFFYHPMLSSYLFFSTKFCNSCALLVASKLGQSATILVYLYSCEFVVNKIPILKIGRKTHGLDFSRRRDAVQKIHTNNSQGLEKMIMIRAQGTVPLTHKLSLPNPLFSLSLANHHELLC